MLIDEASEEFDRLFRGVDVWGQFTSLLPPHEVIVQSLADPSISPHNINANTSIHGYKVGGLNYQAVMDLQQGTRRMLQKVVLPGAEDGTFGFLAQATPALENIMKFESLPLNMSNTGVYQHLGLPTEGTNAADAIKKVAFAAGMSALSAMGPIGAAAAAIISFGAAIVNAFRRRAVKREQAEEERRKEAYKYFPPLQEPRSEVDTWSVNNMLLPILQTGDWTSIFLPRFSSSRWVVAPRKGGYAIAPGELIDEGSVFSPSGGIGYLPGQNRVTSVLQVSLDPQDPRIAGWGRGGDFPLRDWMVRDVGDFLVNTTRLAAIAWSWVAERKNSPHLYKVDVAKLHEGWKRYSEGGVNTLLERSSSGRNVHDLFTSAIGCAVGVWRCNYRDGRYRGFTSGGTYGKKALRRTPGIFHPNRDPEHGCLMDPYTALISDGERGCLINLYEHQTKKVLLQLRERQSYFLKHSLCCAYVRRSWAAFNDPHLAEQLDQMRSVLLDHPDREHIDLRDVPPEEMHQGENFRSLLVKRGAGKKRGPGHFAAPLKGLIPPKTNAPGVPGASAPMPSFEHNVPGTRPFWRNPRVVGAGLAGAGLLAAGFYFAQRK